MIKVINGDLTAVEDGVILHGCNAQGVMGSGVAKALRDKYPEIFDPYKKVCDSVTNKAELLGEIVPVVIEGTNVTVVNGITQINYGKDGKVYADLTAIRKAVVNTALTFQEDIHLPAIGSGLGGLDWDKEVLPLLRTIDTWLTDVCGLQINIVVYKL
jgi:O-acetyl-ADP-ribose deacetylase (regulator of RNase III)